MANFLLTFICQKKMFILKLMAIIGIQILKYI